MQEFLLQHGSTLLYCVLVAFGVFLLSCTFYLLKCLMLSSYIEQYKRFGKVQDNRLIGKLDYVVRPLPDAATNDLLFRAEKIRKQVASLHTLRKFYRVGLIVFGILVPAVIVGKFIFA